MRSRIRPGVPDDDRGVVGQGLLVQMDVASSEKHLGLDIGHVLCEADVLLLDLEGKLAGVCDDEDLDVLILGILLQHLESGDHEDSGLTHTRLGLAQDVLIRDSTGNARMLDYTMRRLHGLAWNTFRRVLETALGDCLENLVLEIKVLERAAVHAHVVSSMHDHPKARRKNLRESASSSS